jgi:hypothetical protein
MRSNKTVLMHCAIAETLQPSGSPDYVGDSQQTDDSQQESQSVLGKKNSVVICYFFSFFMFNYLTNTVK